MKPSVEVDVEVASASEDIPDESFLIDWVGRALAGAGETSAVSISVRVVDEDEGRSLNRDFRQRDKPTNVLSFPAGDIEGLPEDVAKPLGDLVLCAPVVASEAESQGKAVDAHWAHLLVHGTLHLLGYDHIAEQAAVEMERLETAILAQGGIADPYNAGG